MNKKRIPTEAEIREWAEKQRDYCIKQWGNEDEIKHKVKNVLESKKVIGQILAEVLGLKYDTWREEFEISRYDKSSDSEVFKEMRKQIIASIPSIISEIFPSEEFKLSQKEMLCLKKVYRTMHIEALHDRIEEKAREDAFKRIDSIMDEVLNDEK